MIFTKHIKNTDLSEDVKNRHLFLDSGRKEKGVEEEYKEASIVSECLLHTYGLVGTGLVLKMTQ